MADAIANSLDVPSWADFLVVASSVDEIRATLERTDRSGEALTVLGECTNTVLLDRIRGVVLRILLRNVDWLAADVVRVGAGVSWDDLVRVSLARGLRGLENLSAIPGSVGAAPFQNIGAYGRELAQVLSAVHVIDRSTGDESWLEPSACGFGYRDSRFKSADRDRFLILGVEIQFDRLALDTSYADVAEALRGRSRNAMTIGAAVRAVRAAKLPDLEQHPNVGSFFKNPVLTRRAYDALQERLQIRGFDVDAGRVRVSAARLIDAAGWKDRPAARVAVWHRQPLVIVNRGGARGVDVLDFAQRISEDVFERYDVALEQEPITIGEPYP